MRSKCVFTRVSWIVSVCAVALLACSGNGSPLFDSNGNPVGSIGGGGDTSSCSTDACAAPSGVSWYCEQRFMYGANWAWRTFAGDFGGVTSWGLPGIAGNDAPFSQALAQMKASGVSVIRWWMFPRFLSDAIHWGSDGAPAGVGGTMVADVQHALELAEQHDVYIMLTLFSFDNFRPTTTEYGVYSRGIRPMVVDPVQRQELVENLVAPIADAVESSPYRKRMIAWDIVNEPEWAISGGSVTGGADFPAQPGLDLVTHDQMRTFVGDVANALHAHSGALVSVGGAAIKWPKAWSGLGLDFYQFHYYDWVYENFPYTQVTLQSVGVTDKPVVMGEFPSDGLSAIPSRGLPARSAAEFSADLLANGYAGSLSWAFNDASFPFDAASTKSFADQGGCRVTY